MDDFHNVASNVNANVDNFTLIEPRVITESDGIIEKIPSTSDLKTETTAYSVNMGQSESKKNIKKNQNNKNGGDMHTKGTEMSFGFRKKINTTPKKLKRFIEFNDKCKSHDKINYKNNKTFEKSQLVDLKAKRDANGNTETESTEHLNEVVPRSVHRKIRQYLESKPNIEKAMPTSINMQAIEEVQLKNKKNVANRNTEKRNFLDSAIKLSQEKTTSCLKNNNAMEISTENGNGGPSTSDDSFELSDSKDQPGAVVCGGDIVLGSHKVLQPKTLKFNLNKNTTIEYPRWRGIDIRTNEGNMQTDSKQNKSQTSTRPTSLSPHHACSKFTLQTISLPKPEYPVAVSVNITTPTSPNKRAQNTLELNTVERSTSKNELFKKLNALQCTNLQRTPSSCDLKKSIPVVNNSVRNFVGNRDISSDSGIASIDVALEKIAFTNASDSTGGNAISPKRSHIRRKNCQMVMKSRHTFEVCNIGGRLSIGSGIKDAFDFPKLPADSDHTALLPLHGLSKTKSSLTKLDSGNIERMVKESKEKTQYQKYIKTQFPPKGSSYNAKEIQLDLLVLQKGMKTSETDTFSSKTSSPGSIVSWCNAGESLASKESENKDISISEERKKVPPSSPSLNDSKFAQMASASSEVLLEDETSPSDSLVTSTSSDENSGKMAKRKINSELQQKNSQPSKEFEADSPISPCTPTHTSNSFSLSDCGNLIDDEIADQPALLFNTENQDVEGTSRSFKENTDTSTIIETEMNLTQSVGSQRNICTKRQPQPAKVYGLHSPQPLQKVPLQRAESLDTLSLCDSICSDDLIMNYDVNSSTDSLTGVSSNRSTNAQDINKNEDDMIASNPYKNDGICSVDRNNKIKMEKHESNTNDNMIAQISSQAIRLLNRSRLQNIDQICLNSSSFDTILRASRQTVNRNLVYANDSYKTRESPCRLLQQRYQKNNIPNGEYNSLDGPMTFEKSFKNAMLQDVLQFKKQLLRLRRVLQDTETLNPFENDNAQVNKPCVNGFDVLNSKELEIQTPLVEDSKQELLDLQRQVVYLQGQMDDRERTIRLQKEIIDKLLKKTPTRSNEKNTVGNDSVNVATQTERARPIAIGSENLTRSNPEYTSYITHFPELYKDSTTISRYQDPSAENSYKSIKQTRRHTIISTTLTSYNQKCITSNFDHSKPTTILTAEPTVKPVKITFIGDPSSVQHTFEFNDTNNVRNSYKKNSSTSLEKNVLLQKEHEVQTAKDAGINCKSCSTAAAN